MTGEKKPIFLRVPFYGDKQAASLRHSVNRLICQRFPAALPRVLFSTAKIPKRSPKDRLPEGSSSCVIYQFRCGCGSAYIGRTSRRLAVRSKEHIPKWLLQGQVRQPRSAITSHLLECDCDRPALRDRFSVVSRARSDRLLRILEALFIKRFKPNLCTQKDHVLDLLLPW